MSYITEIIDPSIENIYAFSDIHADIQALIIALRDCAKVIKLRNYNIPTIDLLNINIAQNDNGYIHDLNYEWCGGNSQVVIVGDFIDGIRNNNVHNSQNKIINYANGIINPRAPEHEFYQVELKIFLFINAINRQAISHNGKIHKILGNHEVASILDYNMIYSFMFPSSQTGKENYYRGLSRRTVFNIKNIGYEIMFEGGCGIFLRINNNMFVHGSLQPTNIDNLIQLNNILNNPGTSYIDISSNLKSQLARKLLNDRHYGLPINILSFIFNQEQTNCYRITQDIKALYPTMPDEEINQLRVIVGHCVQNYNKKYLSASRPMYTFNNLFTQDKISKTYTGPRTQITANSNIPIGITMDCYDPVNNNYKLFKVDIGVSRAQDIKITTIKDYDILSRTPQVLHIKTENNVDNFYIIKSNIKNTRIHQYREHFESLHNIPAPKFFNHIFEDFFIYDDDDENMYHTLEDSRLDSNRLLTNNRNIDWENYRNLIDDEWSKKYLKYKKKYLKFKHL